MTNTELAEKLEQLSEMLSAAERQLKSILCRVEILQEELCEFEQRYRDDQLSLFARILKYFGYTRDQ